MDTLIRLFFLVVLFIVGLTYVANNRMTQPKPTVEKTQTVDVEKAFGVKLKGSK